MAPPPVHPEVKTLKERGDQAYAGRDFAAATECYSEALESTQDAVVLSNRSATYAQRRRFDKALLDADKALKLCPGWSRLYHRRGHALFHLGRYNEAMAALEEGLKLDGQDKVLLEAIAKMKEYTAPGDDFWVPEQPEPKAVVKEQPKEAPVKEAAKDASAEAKAPAKGARAGAFSQARAKANTDSKAEGTKPAQGKSAEELREKGNSLFREGNHSKAVRAYDEAIRADSSDARCWANRAAAQMAMLSEFGQGLSPAAMRTNPYFTNSMNDLSESLKLDAKYTKAWARKGQLHAMAAEYSDALAAYDRGLAVDPTHPDCLAGRRFCQTRT